MNGTFNLSDVNNTISAAEASLVRKLIVSLSYGIIEVFGLCGNILVILTIRNGLRRLQTNYYRLVFHLAVCDIVLLLKGNFIFSLRPWLENSYWSNSLGTITCKIIFPLSGCLFTTEIALLVVIAILRHKAVTQPLEPRMSGKKLKVTIALVYITPLLHHIPLFYSQEVRDNQCTNKWKHSLHFIIYEWTLDLIITLIPMVLIIILYTRMCYFMAVHQKSLRRLLSSETTALTGKAPNQLKKSHHNLRVEKNAKMMTITVITLAQFFLAVLPTRVLSKLVLHGRDEDEFHLVWMMPLYFLVSCSFNPIVYGFGDKTIREGYKIAVSKIFSC